MFPSRREPAFSASSSLSCWFIAIWITGPVTIAGAQQTAVWTGPGNGDWLGSGGSAWSSGSVPDSGTADVTVDGNSGQSSHLTVQASQPNFGQTLMVGRLAIDAGDSVTFGSHKHLTIVPGGFPGAGALTVNGGLNFAHGATSLTWGSAATPGPVTLQGTGTIQLGGAGFGGYLGDVVNVNGFFGNSPLVNQTTLAGTFDIGAYNSHSPIIQNSALLHSNIAGQRSSFHVSGATTNTGTLKASNGAILRLGQGNWDNTGGTIVADGSGSIIEHVYGRVTGGTITTANGGEIKPNSRAEWTDLLTSGTTRLAGVLELGGTVTNTGTITVGDGSLLDIATNSNAVTVAGSGEIVLNGARDLGPELINQGNVGFPNVTWTFQDQTVRGRGDVGYEYSGGTIDNVKIINRGTFQADVDGQMLRIDVSNFDNQSSGVLRATGSGNDPLGGILRLSINGPLKNTGGTLEALHGGRIEADAARIEGGLIKIHPAQPNAVPPVPAGSISLAGMTIVNPSAASGTPNRDTDPDGMLLQGDIPIGNTGYTTNSVPRLVGEIKNTGKLRLAATGNNSSHLFLSETAKKYVTLTGGGEVILGTMPDGSLGNDNAFLIESIDGGFATRTLANMDNTIHGFGRIGRDPFYGHYLGLNNHATIAADVPGRTLNVEFNGGSNTGGVFRAQNGGSLVMRTTGLDNTGGVLEALNGSPFRFTGAGVITGGTLRNIGAATGAANFDIAGGTLTDLTLQGPLVLRDNGAATLVGTIQNEGSLRIRSEVESNRTRLSIGSAANPSVTLNGPGGLILGDPSLGGTGSHVEASQSSTNPTLTLNQNLRGFGALGFNYYSDRGMHLVNHATIDADTPGKSLALVPHTIVNSPGKTLRATNGGSLYLHPVQLTNTDARIRAIGANSKVTFDTQTIVDGGVVDSSAGSTIEVLRNLDVRSGAVFTNAGTLLLGTQGGSQTFQGLANGGSSLINSGTVRKIGGGDYSLRTQISSTGSLDVQQGVLRLFGGGMFSGGTHSVVSNADLTFQGSPGYSFTGVSHLGGTGRNWFADGVNITLPSATDQVQAVNLNFENATLTGSGKLTHRGELRFTPQSNNTISGARVETLSGATAKIQSYYSAPLQFTNGATWDNHGTILFDDAGWRPPVVGAEGSTLTNHAGGVIWQDDGERGDIDMALDQRGQLKVTRGSLNLLKSSSWTGGTADIATDTALWNSSTMTLHGASNEISGGGWMQTNGTSLISLTAGSRLSTERLGIWDSAGISGPGDLVVSKAAEWRPPFNGVQVIDATPLQLLEGSVSRLEGGTLRLQNSASFQNDGTFNIHGRPVVELNSGSVFENAGIINTTSPGSGASRFSGDGSGLLRTTSDSVTRFHYTGDPNTHFVSVPFDWAGSFFAEPNVVTVFDAGGLFNETAKFLPVGTGSNITFTGADKIYRSRGQAVEFAGLGYVNFAGTTLQFEPSTVPNWESRIAAGSRVTFSGNNTIKSVDGSHGEFGTTGFVFQSGSQVVDNATLKTTGTADTSVWNAIGQKLELKNGAKFINSGRFVIQSRVGSGLLNDPGIFGDATTLFHNTTTGRLVHDSDTVTEFGIDFLNDGILEFRSGNISFSKDFRGRGGIATSNGAQVNLSLAGVPEDQLPLAFETSGTSKINVALAAGQTLAAGITLNGGQIVAAGGLNMVAAGGGNMVAAGGGNLVAAGGLNMVAAGGGNMVAAGGGNMVAAGGGNIVAAGGGNIVAAGGGNIAARATATGAGAAARSRVAKSTGVGIILAENGGQLWGGGTFQGTGVVESGGVVHPGSVNETTPSSGALTWSGDLEIQNGGILDIELGGTSAGSGHDQINVAGALDMDGILRVSFLNQFRGAIQNTDTFVIATAGSPITGIIDNLVQGRVAATDGRSSFAVNFSNGGTDLVLSDFQTGPPTFSSWLSEHNLVGDDALPTADIDSDGLNNLLEYALGLDPRASDAAIGTTGSVEIGGQRYFTWTYNRPAGSEARTDITYTGERSNTLGSWNAATVVEDPVTPHPTLPQESVRLRSTVPMTQAGNSPEFLHLKVTQPGS